MSTGHGTCIWHDTDMRYGYADTTCYRYRTRYEYADTIQYKTWYGYAHTTGYRYRTRYGYANTTRIRVPFHTRDSNLICSVIDCARALSLCNNFNLLSHEYGLEFRIHEYGKLKQTQYNQNMRKGVNQIYTMNEFGEIKIHWYERIYIIGTNALEFLH